MTRRILLIRYREFWRAVLQQTSAVWTAWRVSDVLWRAGEDLQ
nr:D9 [uncultured bacterium]